ncbi:MAG: CDP-glucose 4,6-dehydratase [Allosphingosinicella sp.]
MEELVDPAAPRPAPAFWRGRRVLLTGHTGFKGAWAALWLARLGAETHGFALAAEAPEALWTALPGGLLASETIGDLRDRAAVAEAVRRARPQIVLHLAAQALVRRGHADPVGTIATNVLGSAHLLAALGGAEAVLIATTDKVYAQPGPKRPFRETDPLGGDDPYSASKASVELIARSFAHRLAIATARAGNVIGGGDFAEDRLVPDLWRAARRGAPLRLRFPQATRPWQHVLDPLAGYLLYLERLAGGGGALPPALNFGPASGESVTVAALAEALGAGGWEADPGPHPPEAAALSLDASLARETLGWRPRLGAAEMIEWTARWYDAFAAGEAAGRLCEAQIQAWESLP